MKLRAWGVGRTIAFIVVTPMAFIFTLAAIMEILSWIRGSSTDSISTTLLFLGFAVFADVMFCTVTLPTCYDSMEVMSGSMSYRELKKVIEKESFEKPIQFWNDKYKKEFCILLVSKNWICVNGNSCHNKKNPVCIPRNLLSEYSIYPGQFPQKREGFDLFAETLVLRIKTTTEYKITLGYIKPNEVKKVISVLEWKIPELKYADMLPEDY